MAVVLATGCAVGNDGPANGEPVPEADEYVLDLGQDRLVVEPRAGLLVNDEDPDAHGLSAVAGEVRSRHGASVELESDGRFTFTPRPGTWGWDSFEYTLEDERGAQAVGRADVLIRPSLASLSEMAGGMAGMTIDGAHGGERAGAGVAGGGDLNGDGLGDVVVGARGPDGEDAGRFYVVFGRGEPSRISLRGLVDSGDGFAIDLAVGGTAAGQAVDIAGDIDGDGLDDLIVGVPSDDEGGDDAGAAYVIFGRADLGAVTRADLEAGRGGFAIRGFEPGARMGTRVSAAGDFNGDGLADVIVGAPLADTEAGVDAGRAVLVFGRSQATAVDVTAPGNAIVFEGEGEYQRAGVDVSEAGDVNGDGLADVIIGAEGVPVNGNNAGRAYVVFGTTDGKATLALADVAEGTGGFALSGEAEEDLLGGAVAGGGDLNGDGFDDVAVGAIGVDATGPYSGRVYVVFGSASPRSLDAVEVEDGQLGLVLHGEAAGDRAGRSVAIVPDTNGDGFDELLVGAHQASYSGRSSGRTYVLYGGEGLAPMTLAMAVEGVGGFALDGEASDDFSSCSLDGAGDVNGDGLHDLVIGARGKDNDNGGSAGRGYVVFGLPRYIACPGDEMCTPSEAGGAVCMGGSAEHSSGRVCG